MISGTWNKPFKIAWNLLLSAINKEFLTFLVFLALSTSFWFVMAFNETYEKELCVPLTMVNVPHNIIITDSLPDTVRVTVRDKGMALIPYFYGNAISPVKIDFVSAAKGNSKGSVTTGELQKLIYPMLSASTKITSLKMERYDFYYNYGLSKRVPVLFDGHVKLADQYYLAQSIVKPDCVTIYASRSVLDSLTEMFTEQYTTEGFKDTTVVELGVKKIRGVKVVPEKVKVHLYADVLTEMTVAVPVTPINTPSGFILRTFPSTVNVKVVVGRNKMGMVKPENFRVVADYREVASHPSDNCKLSIHVVPRGITSASLETQQADYLIEKVE